MNQRLIVPEHLLDNISSWKIEAKSVTNFRYGGMTQVLKINVPNEIIVIDSSSHHGGHKNVLLIMKFCPLGD